PCCRLQSLAPPVGHEPAHHCVPSFSPSTNDKRSMHQLIPLGGNVRLNAPSLATKKSVALRDRKLEQAPSTRCQPRSRVRHATSRGGLSGAGGRALKPLTGPTFRRIDGRCRTKNLSDFRTEIETD